MHPGLTRPVLDRPPPVTFAHRGGGALWPENTLAAFTGAAALGVDFVETDLHLTRDGELVLCHDATVDRTTDGHGRIAEMTLAELRRLDAGWSFTRDGTSFPNRGRGHGIPTLDEALALAPPLRLNLDVKPRDPAVIGRLVDAIALGRLEDRLIVAAHSDAVIQRFRSASRGSVATAAGPLEVARFLAAVQIGLSHHITPAYDVLQVPERTALLHLVDRPFVAAAHRLGIPVHVFTIDSPARMRELLSLGVDGLMTNRPDRLVSVAHHHAASAASGPPAQRPVTSAASRRGS